VKVATDQNVPADEPCACHGEAMYWHKDKRKPPGVHWRCAVKNRQATARYYDTARGQEVRIRSNERRFFAGGMYLGMVGFTETEIDAMVADLTRI
jgi:hypothetical protein